MLRVASMCVGTLLAFALVDAAWIGLFAVDFFKSQLGPLVRAQPDLMAAAAFYPLYAAGLVVLAVLPAWSERSAVRAAGRGGLLGLTAYGTFDLTNLAIIQGWTLQVALVDMAWGTFASALAAFAGYQSARLADARARRGP